MYSNEAFKRAIEDLREMAFKALLLPLRDPAELTNFEKLSIAFIAGCQVGYFDGQLRSRKKLGFALVDGKYHVCESVEDAW